MPRRPDGRAMRRIRDRRSERESYPVPHDPGSRAVRRLYRYDWYSLHRGDQDPQGENTLPGARCEQANALLTLERFTASLNRA